MILSLMRQYIIHFLIGIFVLATLSACAVVPQYEREYLSDPILIFDENPLGKGMQEHYRDYREGSSGGTGAQAGGCGC